MKYYRMAIKNKKTGEKDTYVSVHQGTAPAGWECTGVLGYFEKPSKNEEKRKKNKPPHKQSELGGICFLALFLCPEISVCAEQSR